MIRYHLFGIVLYVYLPMRSVELFPLLVLYLVHLNYHPLTILNEFLDKPRSIRYTTFQFFACPSESYRLDISMQKLFVLQESSALEELVGEVENCFEGELLVIVQEDSERLLPRRSMRMLHMP